MPWRKSYSWRKPRLGWRNRYSFFSAEKCRFWRLLGSTQVKEFVHTHKEKSWLGLFCLLEYFVACVHPDPAGASFISFLAHPTNCWLGHFHHAGERLQIRGQQTMMCITLLAYPLLVRDLFMPRIFFARGCCLARLNNRPATNGTTVYKQFGGNNYRYLLGVILPLSHK